jgi:hypothetical protein
MVNIIKISWFRSNNRQISAKMQEFAAILRKVLAELQEIPQVWTESAGKVCRLEGLCGLPRRACDSHKPRKFSMKSPRFLSLGAALFVTSIMQGFSFSQVNQPLRTPAAMYFGSRSASNQMSQNQQAGLGMGNYAPTHQPTQVSDGKPFQDIQRQPTLSPYLALDLVESSTGLPNYTMFVQPQLQQRAANEAQERELQRLRQQVRVATARGVVSKNPTAGVPTTGSSMQFMNVGSYFPSVR